MRYSTEVARPASARSARLGESVKARSKRKQANKVAIEAILIKSTLLESCQCQAFKILPAIRAPREARIEFGEIGHNY